jgi:hypothetical protein
MPNDRTRRWDPPEQAALSEIRRLRSQRTTLRGIAAALNQRDFRTRRGTPWRLEFRGGIRDARRLVTSVVLRLAKEPFLKPDAYGYDPRRNDRVVQMVQLE